MNTETAEMHEANRRFLADLSPLPDAVTLARPIVEALEGLWSAFYGRGEAMAYDYELGTAYEAEANQLVDTIDDVCEIVRAVVHGMPEGDDRSGTLASSLEPVLRAITGTNGIRHIRALKMYDASRCAV